MVKDWIVSNESSSIAVPRRKRDCHCQIENVTGVHIGINRNGVEFKVSHACSEGLGFWVKNYLDWEPHTFKVFDKILKKDMSYFDIGTFTGHTLLYAAQKVNSVYGVELDLRAFEACKQNIATNSYSNAKLSHAAIYNKDGEVWIPTKRMGSSGCRVVEPALYEEHSLPLRVKHLQPVRSLTIESLMNEWEVKTCDFIKMDIEGGEETCLPAMQNFFETHKPILYLSVHKHLGATSRTIVESTSCFNYVYDKNFNNIKDSLGEVIDSKACDHGEQDYLFTFDEVK